MGALRRLPRLRRTGWLLAAVRERTENVLTGGCSSVFSPRSGLASRFAKTPSLEEENGAKGAPLLADGTGVIPGNCVTALCSGAGLTPPFVDAGSGLGGEGLPRMSRWRSSSPLWLSESEPDPSSKVSARVLSASEVKGSSEERRCRDVNEEARDLKEGGGD
jgi:hypothetical protein